MPDTFKFELVSPERLLMSEDALQVKVPGAEGDFTVLPRHAPVLANLRSGVLDVTLADASEHKFFLRSGFAEVGPDRLTVLAEHAVDLDALNSEVLAQEIRNAEEDVTDAKDDAARDRAQEKLDRLRLLESSLQLS